MIRSRKQPIRTYQRKTAKKFMNLLTLPVQKIEKNDPIEDVRKHFDKDGSSNESLNYDLFETTFDKLAKEIVIPPLPPDINRNDSWNGNSSDSDINNMTNIKSGHDIFFTSNLDKNKFVHKNHKKPQQYDSNTITSKEMLFKKSKTTLTKAETQSKIKVQEQKKQTSKIRKKKKVKQNKSKESTCNKQQPYSKSDTLSNLTDVKYKNNISRNKNIKYSSEKILKIDKTTMLQTTLDNFVTDLKYMSSHFQDIKPCFVKLDNCITHNWHILNAEKNITDKQNLSYDTKSLQTNKDISKIVHNTNSQSIAMEYNDIIGNFKNISFKSCSVVLCDNIVGNCSEKCNGCSDAYNKSSVSNSAFHNSSKTISHCNSNGKLAICNTKRNNKNIIKDSFVKIEKLKIEEFVKKDNVTFNEKERHIIVSSTPIDKCVKPSNYSALFSPIDTEDIQLKQNYLKKTKKNISKISSSHKYPNKKICLSIAQSKDYKFDATDTQDIQEQQTQVLLSSQNTQIVEDFAVKPEPSSTEIYTIFTQKYNIEHDVEMEFPLNTFANIDQSRLLFDDSMIHNYNYSTQNIPENEIKNEIDETMSFSVDLHSKSKQFLNNNADSINASLQHKSPLKLHMALQNVDMQQEQNDECQRNMVTYLENFKNETINSNHSLWNDDDQENIVNDGQFIQLQDSRITRRIQYPKQQYLNMANISENFNDENMQSNDKIFHYIVSNEDFNFHQQLEIMNNLEHLKNTNLNTSSDQFESFGSIQQYNDNINKQTQKSIFLKPGKSWTRSLSILNNIKDECNLDKLSIGKGRKWKNSVRDLLNMQKQGIFQSLKGENNDTDLPCAELNGLNISLFDISKHNKTFNSTNHIRFSKRISVRVVLNDTSAKHDVKDTSFLEAFGISTENSLNSELSYQTHSLVHNDLIRIRSTTAKDVVLKKCAQQCYLSFSECFPDSYLEHCCKIGEGVYGEVFLYDYNNKKSVIKIIPIEGKELVNGEPQKKFNEILSEIVIAKELDNLRLNNVHRTRGFVEVKSIKCIIGKYPEKLIKLWNIYDEEKTSDNDCPSMFDENQLYIALELDHGGEDLEAFVFQTAREAHALFLQIALALAIAEKTLEFEHRDLHWGNVLISRTKDKYVYYNLNEKEIKLPSNGVKVTIIDFTLSRMLYQECCIYNDLALDPDLFTAHGEYQFEIYRLMRDKIQNNWQKFEPYTNILWLHYILDKMITMVRYKRKNLKTHKHAIARLKELKNSILNYDSTYNFVTDSNNIIC